jgi:hypothetical protein
VEGAREGPPLTTRHPTTTSSSGLTGGSAGAAHSPRSIRRRPTILRSSRRMTSVWWNAWALMNRGTKDAYRAAPSVRHGRPCAGHPRLPAFGSRRLSAIAGLDPAIHAMTLPRAPRDIPRASTSAVGRTQMKLIRIIVASQLGPSRQSDLAPDDLTASAPPSRPTTH